MKNELITKRMAADAIYKHLSHCKPPIIMLDLLDALKSVPAVNAENVRRAGNTMLISTDNLDDYADRIVVNQGPSCKVYYADEVEHHAHWSEDGVCTNCGYDALFCSNSSIQVRSLFCPNCGERMYGDKYAQETFN